MDEMAPRAVPAPPPRAKCGWCEATSVTDVITISGKKLRKTAPVCNEHATRFEDAGQMTTRLEFDLKQERSERSRQWKAQHLRY